MAKKKATKRPAKKASRNRGRAAPTVDVEEVIQNDVENAIQDAVRDQVRAETWKVPIEMSVEVPDHIAPTCEAIISHAEKVRQEIVVGSAGLNGLLATIQASDRPTQQERAELKLYVELKPDLYIGGTFYGLAEEKQADGSVIKNLGRVLKIYGDSMWTVEVMLPFPIHEGRSEPFVLRRSVSSLRSAYQVVLEGHLPEVRNSYAEAAMTWLLAQPSRWGQWFRYELYEAMLLDEERKLVAKIQVPRNREDRTWLVSVGIVSGNILFRSFEQATHYIDTVFLYRRIHYLDGKDKTAEEVREALGGAVFEQRALDHVKSTGGFVANTIWVPENQPKRYRWTPGTINPVSIYAAASAEKS